MELTFIHGWGFDKHFWDALAVLLPEYQQQRIGLGFFGEAKEPNNQKAGSILIGHSLGFMHGMTRRQDWSGWIAINGFARFVQTPQNNGCVAGAALRDMRKRLAADPKKTLGDFYQLIGTQPPRTTSLNAHRLCEGLDELAGGDVEGILSSIKMPGLALATRDDPLVPVATSEKLGEKARLLWHETSGHMLPQADPGWCADAIKGFLAEEFG